MTWESWPAPPGVGWEGHMSINSMPIRKIWWMPIKPYIFVMGGIRQVTSYPSYPWAGVNVTWAQGGGGVMNPWPTYLWNGLDPHTIGSNPNSVYQELFPTQPQVHSIFKFPAKSQYHFQRSCKLKVQLVGYCIMRKLLNSQAWYFQGLFSGLKH